MIPLASISAKTLGKRISKVTTEAQEKSGFLTTYLVELFKNHKLIKIFQKEKYEKERADQYLSQLKDKNQKIALIPLGNIDKDKTIILIYTHGQWGGDQKLNGCNRRWSKIPPAIYQLNGTKIKDLTIKTYQLCSGVRGLTQSEKDKFWATYDKNNQDVNSVLNLKDKNGILFK